MTIIKADGTIYKVTREGQVVTYCLWGSDDPAQKWSAQLEGEGGDGKLVSLFKNAQTGVELEELPDIPVEERVLRIEDKHVMMLQFYFHEIKSVDDPAYKLKPREEIIQHLVHYNNDVEKIFMMLFALMDRGRWPTLYQLIALYAEKEPAKLHNIPQILKQYPTLEKQAELMSKLADKYNDKVPFREPPPLPTVDPVYKEKLTKFFTIVDPKSVPGVDEMILLLKVEGDSLESYVHQLAIRHPEHAAILGVQTSAPAQKDYAALLRTFFQTHNPENLPRIPQLLQQWVGREESLLQALAEKFKAAASTTQLQQQYITQEEILRNPYYSRLQEYYSKHNPEKKEAALCELIRNHWGKEEELVTKLVKKYGEPFPTEEEANAFRRDVQDSMIVTEGENPYKKILVELYQKHNPVKIPGIDELLRTYAGTEEELISKIRAKYEGSTTSASPETTEASPAAAVASPSPPKVQPATLKQQVHDFFKKHNPERIGHIDLIIKQYSDLGKQDQLVADLHKRYGIEYSPPSSNPLTKVLSSLPDPLIHEGIQYDRAVTGDKKVIYTRQDAPGERWLVNVDSGVNKYVAVGGDESVGWESLPKVGPGGKIQSKPTKHCGVMAVPDYSQIATNTTSIETQERGSAAVAQQYEDKCCSADFLLGSVDSLFELPPDLATASMQLMEVKEDLIRSSAAEKRLQKEVLSLRARLSEVTGIIESRAHLADPQADAAREMYFDFKKMEKQEMIAKTVASESQKALRVKTDQCDLLSREGTHLTSQLRESRNRERKLLKDIAALQAANQPTERQPDYASDTMRFKLMQREISKKDSLLWGLSQDLLNTRWGDLDRGFAKDECMNTFMTSHLERPVSPTLQDVEIQTADVEAGPSSEVIEKLLQETTQKVTTRLTSEHQKQLKELQNTVAASSSEKDTAFDSAVEASFLFKKVSSFLQLNAPSQNRDKTLAFVKRYWEDVTCSEDKLLTLIHEKYSIPYRAVPDYGITKDKYYLSKLQEFYKEHNPAKLDSVNKILTTFNGNEEALMVKLYGTFKVPLENIEPSPGEIRSSDLFKSVAKTLKNSHPSEVFKTDELTRKLWPARADRIKIENVFKKKYGVGIDWVSDLGCQTDATSAQENENITQLTNDNNSLRDKEATAAQTIFEKEQHISELVETLEEYHQNEFNEYLATSAYAAVVSLLTSATAEKFRKIKKRKKSPKRERSQSPTGGTSPPHWPSSPMEGSPPRSLIRGEKAYGDAIASYQRIKTLTQISQAAAGRKSPPRQTTQKMESRPDWRWSS